MIKILNKKICILGRNYIGINNKKLSGLTVTTNTLLRQINEINIGTTQLVNIGEIEKNINILKKFEIIIIDELIFEKSFENEESLNVINSLKMIKKYNDKIKIIYINHLNWFNYDLFNIIDLVLQVKPSLLEKNINSNKYNIKIPIIKYSFQVSDNFTCVNGQINRFSKFISIVKFNKYSFDYKYIDFLYKNDNINIDFFGFFETDDKEYIRQVNELFEKKSDRYNFGGFINRDKLPYFLNNYKYFILNSPDNITSLQSIEQLKCGCMVFMNERKLDGENNIIDHSNDIKFFNDINKLPQIFEQNKDYYNPFEIQDRQEFKFGFEPYKEELQKILKEY